MIDFIKAVNFVVLKRCADDHKLPGTYMYGLAAVTQLQNGQNAINEFL